MNKDVFETFYLKRTSKSSHSSKSSNDSIRGADDPTPTLNKPNSTSMYLTNDKRQPTQPTNKFNFPVKNLNFNNGKSASIRSEKSKPRQYLFGSTFDKTHKDEPEKENIYNNVDQKNPDRFKTITINSLRRSFRDTFLDTTKPAKGREHQQLWFIDANDIKKTPKPLETTTNNNHSFQQHTTKIQNNDITNGTDPFAIENRKRATVKRNETFRIDNNDTNVPKRSNGITALGRRETFRVNGEQSPIRSRERLRSPSIDSNNSYTLAANKVIPVGITSPYNSLNDIDDNRKLNGNSRRITQRNYNIYNRFDDDNANDIDDNDDGPNDSNYFDNKQKELPSPHSRDTSPLKYDRHRPSSATNKTLIEIKSPDNSSYLYNYTTKDPFESRSIPERQSFHDFNNDSLNRPRAHRSYASLRTKPDASAYQRRKPSLNSYDEIDEPADPYKTWTKPQAEAWRSITSRQFNNDSDTENRSFVPYRNNFNRKPTITTPNNCNRTTININYNYNMSPTAARRKESLDPNNMEYINRTINSQPVNKSTSAIKSNCGKDKSNKNRSVNFPSVECEVRLISPNYDTKPRRKESWKAKPTNDWTFNKVHL